MAQRRFAVSCRSRDKLTVAQHTMKPDKNGGEYYPCLYVLTGIVNTIFRTIYIQFLSASFFCFFSHYLVDCTKYMEKNTKVEVSPSNLI